MSKSWSEVIENIDLSTKPLREPRKLSCDEITDLKEKCNPKYDLTILDLICTIEALQQENEQLQELAKAKADGRLVVLPVKAGDRVYSIYGYLNKSIREDTVKHICVQDGEIRLTMDNTCTKIWERSAFATREEAEKALQEGMKC